MKRSLQVKTKCVTSQLSNCSQLSLIVFYPTQDIEIKKPQGAQPFAFLQFSNIDSVVKARKTLDGEYVGKNKVKLGFGKSMATSCIWLDNLSEKLTENQLSRFFSLRFGPVSRIVLDKTLGRALVFFYQLDHAQKTMQEIKNGLKISGSGRRPKVKINPMRTTCQLVKGIVHHILN